MPSGFTILRGEDERGVRLRLTRGLETAGASVTVVPSLAKALAERALPADRSGQTPATDP